MKKPSSFHVRLGAILLAGIIARIWFWQSTHLTVEDALITFRYAENLARGNGFVYNVGEKILGTTTPLWTIILSITKTLGFDLFTSAKVLGILFDSLTCILIFSLLSRYNSTLALLWALLFSIAPDIIPTSMSGMETSLFLFTMSLTCWGAIRKNAAFATGIMLMILARLDGAIFAATVIVCGLFIDRRWFFKNALAGIVLLVPWLVWSLLYFGTFIPQSITAKLTGYQYHLRGSLTPFLNYFSPLIDKSIGILLLKNLLFILLISGIYSIIREKRELLLFPLFFFIYCLLYMFSGKIIFTWYVVPAIFCWLVLLANGIHFIWTKISFRIQPVRWRYLIVTFTIVIIVVSNLVILRSRIAKYSELQQCEEATREKIGLWLNGHAAPGSSVFLEPLGYVGYFAGLSVRFYDEIGLITREAHAYQNQDAGWYVRALQNLQPDYIVQYSHALETNRSEGTGNSLFATTEQEDWFNREYQPVVRFDLTDKFPGIDKKEKSFIIFRHIRNLIDRPPGSFSSLILPG